MKNPVVTTDRLRLCKLLPSDAPAMFAYRADPEVCRYQSFEPGALADVEAFIGRMDGLEFDTAGTWFQFAIRLADTDLLVGDVGVHFTDDDPRQVEIGFTVAPSHQGQGIATETVAGLLKYLLNDCGKHRVFASVDPRNQASLKLLERVGMRQEAHFRRSLWFKDEWVDDVVFAMLSDELS